VELRGRGFDAAVGWQLRTSHCQHARVSTRENGIVSVPSSRGFEFEIGSRLACGDWSGAMRAAERCRTAWPAEAAGWLLGSIAALLGGDKEIALALVVERLTTDPAHTQCLLQKAECLLALGHRAEALSVADAASGAAAAVPSALDAIGKFLVYAGEHMAALQIYNKAVAGVPDDPSFLAKRAAIHRFLGDFNLASDDYKAVLRHSPTDSEAMKELTELRCQSPKHNCVVAMEAALAVTPAESTDAATLHFGLAKSYEDLADYSASWRHLTAGNDLERSRIRYSSEDDCAAIERLIGAFPNRESLRPDTTGERPIFIVGLPRSGTTLVERIIGSHSQVHSAGELPALSEAIGAVAARVAPRRLTRWLEYAAMLGVLDGQPIAQEYLARSRGWRGQRPRFSDKQPTNFLYCALILRAFPNACIVHLTRHPMAACYAIYKTRFGGTYSFSYDLAELGDLYIGYRRLMAHWHRVLPGRILDVAYEDVVNSLEATTRRLLDFVGLPFEDGCLEFHLNLASTATASAVQVRQPLYDSSLDLWRHHSVELTPLRVRLETAGIRVD
jgi:tetratricopeptide (TPR) repeat protein